MPAVVAMLRTATAAMAARIDRGPNPPISKVASGGPATQANDTSARVRTTSPGAAPVCFRCANSSELPTPAGPPSSTRPATATGSDVVAASAPARASVSSPQASIGRT